MSKKRPQFNHDFRREGDVVIVAMRGSLDGAAAMELKPKIDQLLNDNAKCVVFDCQELSYIGLHGYWIMLVAAKELQRRKGCFALCHAAHDLKEIFRLASMMRLKIPTFDSLDGALTAVRKKCAPAPPLGDR